MNAGKIKPSVENRTKLSVENRTGRLSGLAVALEMNPSLRDLSDEELSELLVSEEFVREWTSCKSTEP